jgi:hypothetical protein
MVAQARGGNNDPSERPINEPDSQLLRRLGEMASGKDVSEDQQVLARALIGVINSQAQLAELMRQIMQFVTEQKAE